MGGFVALVAAATAFVVGVEALPVQAGEIGVAEAIADALIGLSFVWAGAVVGRVWPGTPAGLFWAGGNLMYAEDAAALRTLGLMVFGAFGAPLAQLLLAFPSGRVDARR